MATPVQHVARSENPSEVAALHGYVHMCPTPSRSEIPLLHSQFPSNATYRVMNGIQTESQNTDHSWLCLWSLRSSRLDHRVHRLLREAEEAEAAC